MPQMDTPRILLVGRVGQVGYELRRTLAPMADITSVDFPDIDLTQPDSIRHWVRETRPHVVINAAAYTAVDKAETDEATAAKINGTAPGILAEEAARLGAWIVHYSTDYIFDGTKRTPYVESDAPNPVGAYGRTKLAGDLAVQAANPRHLIFRLCWVYGARGGNFMLTMMRLARERDRLRVVNDQSGCPTWSRMIAQATTAALAKSLTATDSHTAGTYHLAASGSTTWHGFAQSILDQMPTAEKKCAVAEPIPSSEYPTPAQRPAYSVLDCEKLSRTFGLKLPDWHTSLLQVLEK